MPFSTHYESINTFYNITRLGRFVRPRKFGYATPPCRPRLHLNMRNRDVEIAVKCHRDDIMKILQPLRVLLESPLQP